MSKSLQKEKKYIRSNYLTPSIVNFRSTLREMPGFNDDYEDWTQGDFTYRDDDLEWLGIKSKVAISPSPRHDPDLPKEPQYTVSFMRKHLPDSVFVKLFSGYRKRVDHDANEVKIPQDRVEREARKIDEVLEDKISEKSISEKVKGVLSSNRGKLEKPSNLASMKKFLVGEEERYEPPVQKADMIHRAIPDYKVRAEN